jgi:hypothetical protein
MTAIRFQIFDPRGECKVPNGMLSAPEHTTAEQDARGILEAPDNAGWRCVLWKDVALFGSVESLGAPDVDVTA